MSEYAIEVENLSIKYKTFQPFSIKKNLLQRKHNKAETFEAVKIIMNVLSDSVCRRMREENLAATTVTVSMRDTKLMTVTRQKKIEATNISSEILHAALELVRLNHSFEKPLRSIGISLGNFRLKFEPQQLNLLINEKKRTRQRELDSSVDALKKRFGSFCVRPAVLLCDKALSDFSPKEDHIVHPIGFFNREVN